MKEKKKSVLFILPYPVGKAPSQRFRVEQLLPLLDEAGIHYTLAPFMDTRTWNILYKGGSVPAKAWGIVKGYLLRWKHVLIDVPRHDIVFIHREAAPLGPPVFEWIITKLGRKKTVYDFDDAIWMPNTSEQNKLAARLKAFWKVGRICSWVHTVTAGNDFLCSYASSKGAKNVMRVPTVVDTEKRYNVLKEHHGGKLVVGWTGSHSTLKYLEDLVPVLQELQESISFTVLVIADKKPVLPLKDWTFIPWDPNSEISDLLKMDIGLMPLTKDRWSEGKCGFKLIQYLSLAIPAVASSVGVNNVIINEGKSGFLVSDDAGWGAALKRLLTDEALRTKMGAEGRACIVSGYSIISQKDKLIELLKS